MAFSHWFKPDGALQDLTLEDLRREEHRLRIREDQAVARLQQMVAEKEDAFQRGAEDRSVALRRILARKFAATRLEQAKVERDLLRLGKDLHSVRALLAVAEGGKKHRGLAEAAADLQVSYEDDKIGEASYRDALLKALGIPGPVNDTVAEVFKVWRALDRGEYSGVAEARRALSEATEKGEKAEGKS